VFFAFVTTHYGALLQVVLPLFVVIGAGVALRRAAWLTPEADASLLNLVVKFLYPALILDNVLGNPSLRNPGNLFLPPLLALITVVGGILLAYQIAGAIGLGVGAGRRTFAFTCGIYNYAYIPIPLASALYGKGTLGVLLVHNVGCEAAIWTAGVFVLSGISLRAGWRRLVNPATVSLLLAIVLNLTGLVQWLPSFLLTAIHGCGACAVPIGLLVTGAALEEFFFRNPGELLDRRVTPAAWLLRFGLLPLLMLALARWLPLTVELKRVIVIQAAMPSAILPLVIAKHFGGRPRTAAQVIVGTNGAALLIIPIWLALGAAFVGV
jgi:predicted permease